MWVSGTALYPIILTPPSLPPSLPPSCLPSRLPTNPPSPSPSLCLPMPSPQRGGELFEEQRGEVFLEVRGGGERALEGSR